MPFTNMETQTERKLFVSATVVTLPPILSLHLILSSVGLAAVTKAPESFTDDHVSIS